MSFHGIAAFRHFDNLTELCVQLGISVSVRAMPVELRGHNSLYNGDRAITIAERQWFPGAKEHTLLHELRELLEHTFVHLGFSIAASREDLEDRAEQFACMVRASLAGEMTVGWLEQAEQVERKWLRYGAYLLCVVGGLAVIASCILLPKLEDQAAEFHQLKLKNSIPTNPSVL